MATAAIPPPYFITADDKRGLIVVTVALVLAFVWTCSSIRIWLRWQKRDWKADDWLLAFATVSGRRPVCAHVLPLMQLLMWHKLVHTIQSGIIFHLVKLGLGTLQDGIPSSQLEQLGKVSLCRVHSVNPAGVSAAPTPTLVQGSRDPSEHHQLTTL
jgi:hypothetical protein